MFMDMICTRTTIFTGLTIFTGKVKFMVDIQAYKPEFLDGLHKSQEEFLEVFDDSIWLNDGVSVADDPKQYFMLEWHRRARKTTLGLTVLAKEAARVPNARYRYFAPTQVMAREIAWNDPYMIKDIIPSGTATFNEQQMRAKFKHNNSIIEFSGADIVNPDKKRGVDAIGVFFDEWSLIPQNLWTEMYRPIIAGPLRKELAKITLRWAMFDYTPKGINHATQMFDRAACVGDGEELPTKGEAARTIPGWFASRLIATESGLISQKQLEEARRDMPREMFEQEFMCARITEEQKAIITSAALDRLSKVSHYEHTTRRFISCDPSLGGDEAPIYVFENTKIIDKLYMRERSQKIVAGEIDILAKRNHVKYIIVDAIGIGNEIASRLGEMGYNVYSFQSAGEPRDKDRFANLKIEAWWQVRNRISELDCEYPEDEILRQQITSVKYDISRTGKLICEPKEKTKKDIGCSPDRADAYIMGLWFLPMVEPIDDSNLITKRRTRGVSIPRSIAYG
jgi:hypothetical protein